MSPPNIRAEISKITQDLHNIEINDQIQ